MDETRSVERKSLRIPRKGVYVQHLGTDRRVFSDLKRNTALGYELCSSDSVHVQC
jgi:hypothetical protein